SSHGRACPGHPRLSPSRLARKAWMPATSAGMTLGGDSISSACDPLAHTGHFRHGPLGRSGGRSSSASDAVMHRLRPWGPEGANRSMTMHKSTTLSMMLTAGVLSAAIGGIATPAPAQDTSAQATYRDIEQTLGQVPNFFKMI